MLLVVELIQGRAQGPVVLLTALVVWITNVIAFSLVDWKLDRGGPVARRVEGINDNARQDFRFPQQDNPTGFKAWQVGYLDYAYISLTNMMASSPTDAMPLTVRAKGFIAYQAFTGFVLLALVISRAVNIHTWSSQLHSQHDDVQNQQLARKAPLRRRRQTLSACSS